jgi:hypothetical protein
MLYRASDPAGELTCEPKRWVQLSFDFGIERPRSGRTLVVRAFPLTRVHDASLTIAAILRQRETAGRADASAYVSVRVARY